MNNVEPEILVIDDNSDFAQSAADLIHIKYGLSCISACDKYSVLEALQHNIIKVAIIDQVMPEIKGTDLFLEIKKVSPTTKAIMLTGEATSDDMGHAMNIGFSSYLNKKEITKLPDYVFKQYVEYEKQHHNNLNTCLLFTERKLFVLPIITYTLVSVDKINNSFVFDDSWKTATTIHAGEEQEIEFSIEFEDEITISEENESKIKGELDINSKSHMNTLKSTINTELNKKYSSQHHTSEKEIHKSKRKWSLPKEPDDTSVRHIIKRDIENAPIYNEYRIIIKKECKLCKSSQIFPLTIYKQTNKIKTRQIDYYSDNSKTETDTGVEKF
ncbi:MAG: response regulator [Bacteroidales bacterium]|nr:response regulator [Bacteroidales bacterium]